MDEPQVVVDRLLRATNEHDLDAIAACFGDEYENETPVHPARSFRGRDQVRRNWEQILTFVPDLHAEIVARATHGSTAWTEWAISGTRRDGTAHEMRGVILFVVAGDEVTSARFYLEPIAPADDGTVDDAVRAQVIR